ncbi:hypothetical protein CQ016_01500 [Arthrobacter sp. MYb222]|nr:hypothetical protein CQ016_01500 [Arthrobacter sp. MYb222]
MAGNAAAGPLDSWLDPDPGDPAHGLNLHPTTLLTGRALPCAAPGWAAESVGSIGTCKRH